MAYNKSHVCRIITASNCENNYLQPLNSFEKSESCSVVSDSLWPHGLYSPWNSPDQNTGVGSHSLLQSIFPNAEIEPRSPALRADSLPAEPPGGRPRILEWVAYPFFSGSSQSRNRTSVSCIAGGFFTDWAIREVHSFEKFPEDRHVFILYPVHPPSKSWLHIYYRPLKCFCE